MKTDIQVGDAVACTAELGDLNSHHMPCWAFPPDVGSVWVVKSLHGRCTLGGREVDTVGLRLVGDVLWDPAVWPVTHFRKVFPRADEKSAALDVRKPTTVRA